MRSRAIPIAIICLVAGAGCTTPSDQPPTIDPSGVMHYTAPYVAQKIVCDGHPIVLEGDHTAITLTGACRLVTLAGSHNDVTVDMAAGGRFDITGSHNDVNWRQAEPGPPAVMQNHGASNTYHSMQAHG